MVALRLPYTKRYAHGRVSGVTCSALGRDAPHQRPTLPRAAMAWMCVGASKALTRHTTCTTSDKNIRHCFRASPARAACIICRTVYVRSCRSAAATPTATRPPLHRFLEELVRVLRRGGLVRHWRALRVAAVDDGLHPDAHERARPSRGTDLAEALANEATWLVATGSAARAARGPSASCGVPAAGAGAVPSAAAAAPPPS